MNHQVYTNSMMDIEFLLSIIRTSTIIDSILINHNIEFTIDETIPLSNTINLPNVFIIDNIEDKKNLAFYMLESIYNEYISNCEIVNINNKKYFSAWTNTVKLEIDNKTIILDPLIKICLEDDNKNIIGFDYLRNYALDVAVRTLLPDITNEKIKKIFINLTSYPICSILLM